MSAVSISLRQSNEDPLFGYFFLFPLTFTFHPWSHVQRTFLILFWKVRVVRETQFWNLRPTCGMSLERSVKVDYLTFYFPNVWHLSIAFMNQEPHFANIPLDVEEVANWQKRALSLFGVLSLDQPLQFFHLRYSCDIKSLWGSWMDQAKITD